jgi:anti-sigma regulatory factor (Ser/Thr protein kinase)
VLEQSFDADSLPSLRTGLARHARRLGTPPEAVERLITVANELATNAIRHGGGRGHLRLWQPGSMLCCQVSDNGPGIVDPTVGTTRPAPDADRGRGLWICRQLTHELTISCGPEGRGTTVTAAIPTSRP